MSIIAVWGFTALSVEPQFAIAQRSAETQMWIKIHLEGDERVNSGELKDLDLVKYDPIENFADYIVSSNIYRMLLTRGYSIEVLSDDLRSVAEERLARSPEPVEEVAGHMIEVVPDQFHSFPEVVTHIFNLQTTYPGIVKVQSIGTSWENRPIWLVKISESVNVDDPDKPGIFFMGVHHAREVITPEVLIYFMDYLTTNYTAGDPDVIAMLANRQIWIIPVVNPDGHEYVFNTYDYWRKNRRDNGDGTFGVDLNRNYSYMWGYDNSGSSPNTGSSTYRGPAAFSEPETDAIRNWFESAGAEDRPVSIAISYHSYGDLWIYPWGYIPEYTPEHEIFDLLSDSATAYNGYVAGLAINTVGYSVNGDTDDWMYGEQVTKDRIFGMTPEVGHEFIPPASQILPLVQENLMPNIVMTKLAGLEQNTVSIADTAGFPGDADVPVILSLDNVNKVSSIEFTIRDVPGWLTAVGADATTRAQGFLATVTQVGNDSHILFNHPAGELISPGDGPVMDLLFDVDPDASLGDQITLSFRNPTVNDSAGMPTITMARGGSFLIGMFMDLNGDALVDVADVIVMIELILNDEYNVLGDLNEDDELNIFDALMLINHILGRTVEGSTGFKTANTDDSLIVGNGQGDPGSTNNVVKINLTNSVPIAGVQFTVKDTPDVLTATDVILTDRMQGSWMLAFRDSVSLLVLLPGWDSSIDPGNGPILNILYDVSPSAGQGPIELQLYDVSVVDTNYEIDSVIAVNGTFNQVVGVDANPVLSTLPAAYSLRQNYPNPFNSSTVFAYSLPERATPEITVYDIRGATVRRWRLDSQAPGVHFVTWDGRSEDGSFVGSGIYLYVLKANNFMETKKALYLK